MPVSSYVEDGLLGPSFPLPIDRPFTAVTARAERVPRYVLTALCADGYLRQPVPGVYVACTAGDSTRLRLQVLALVVPEDCVVVDRHAAWLHGATMALEPNEHHDLRPIRIFRPAGSGRLRRGLADSGERGLSETDVVELDGVRCTSLLRTTWDLGRVRSRERAIAGIDAMMGRPGFPRQEFLAGIDRFRGHRWVTTLREIAPLGDGRAESPPESVLRLRWLDLAPSLPAPEPQIEVFRPDGSLAARLDLGDRRSRHAAEYDGAEWHTSPTQLAHDRERRTEVDGLDWHVQVFTAANVFGPLRDVEEILLAGAREARRRFGIRAA